MSWLDACPLCRSIVAADARSCSSCGADLAPYLDLNRRGEAYAALALELLLRGELEAARGIIERLGQLTQLEPLRRSELLARLALAEGDWEAAAQHIAACPPDVAAQLEAQLALCVAEARRSRELYNLALAEARQQAYTLAARLLLRSVQADPRHHAAWQLKLKVDLLSGDSRGCYEDLVALDRLAARPPQFIGLERLLPPAV